MGRAMSELQNMVLSLLEAGHTQEQIAKTAGIAQSSVSKIKTGKKKEVLSSKARRLQAMYYRTFFAESEETKSPVIAEGASCSDR